MTEREFWQYKLIQLFHDPPGKVLDIAGHKQVADELFRQFAEEGRAAHIEKLRATRYRTKNEAKGFLARPDRAAAGADRPFLPFKGMSLSFRNEPLVTHPLCGTPHLRVSFAYEEAGSDELSPEAVAAFQEQEHAALGALQVQMQQDSAAGDLRSAFLKLWRALPRVLEQLSDGRAGLLWDRVPADSRCPDVSIWDHLRVTSALAFLDTPNRPFEVPEERRPLLLLFSVGPVGSFLRESRKSQDLWISSFLLSELAFAAMGPIIKHYGPDAIVYPDLRENPRVDRWLADWKEGPGGAALPERDPDPLSYASLIPNRFTAILPRGGAGHLRRAEEVARECRDAAKKKWDDLTGTARKWLEEECQKQGLDPAPLRQRWDEQVAFGAVLRARFVAVPWRREEGLRSSVAGGAIPARLPEFRESERQREEARSQRLAPWTPPDAWAQHEAARGVFLAANPLYFTMERGFDYALYHHQLRARYALRDREGDDPAPPQQRGEMCTLCGRRAALGPGRDESPLDEQREAVRSFWRRLDKEKAGQERLCAVCATKRYLVKATKPTEGINRIWGGGDNNERRVPFPSTSAMAAQRYLRQVAQDPRLRQARQAITAVLGDLNWDRNQFPGSLLPLAAVQRGDEAFLQYECQILFPHALRAELRRQLYRELPDWTQVDEHLRAAREGRRGPRDAAADLAAKLVQLERAVETFGHQVRELAEADRREGRKDVIAEPGRRFALVKLDGDSMGKLLLGSSIRATWRDVLHPEVVRRIETQDHLREIGWRALLDRPRLMGPSLHAFLSRALAEFADRIAPWVVEREFGGRLIYAGGDDLLAMTPEEDALPMAARLQALFSAAWVVDTRPEERPWDWRRPGAVPTFNPERDRGRFHILSGVDEVAPPPTPQRVLPMLGRHHSLSAGIAYAHFKTGMGTVLAQASHLLDHIAKEPFHDRPPPEDGWKGRAAVALACFTRGGAKGEFALPWCFEDSVGNSYQAAAVLDLLVRAFRDGQLPGKLPYKLRDRTSLMDELRRQSSAGERQARMRRMVRDALDGEAGDGPLLGAVVALWEQGFHLHAGAPERSADGLLLCRTMAQSAEDGDEDGDEEVTP